MTHWIQTSSGVSFDFSDIRNSPVFLMDITHALSQLCRFTGHTWKFYSVAQHSVVVSHLVKPENALLALMHDATEAYVGDVSRPLKSLLPNYQEIEAQVWQRIREKFDLPEINDDVVQADQAALDWERSWLFAPKPPTMPLRGVESRPDALGIPKQALSPQSSAQAFLGRFRELT